VLWPDLPNLEMVHRDFPIEHCMDAVSCIVGSSQAAGENRRHTQVLFNPGNAKGSRMRMLCRSHIPQEPFLEIHIVPVTQSNKIHYQDHRMIKCYVRRDMRSCCEGNLNALRAQICGYVNMI